MVEPEITTMSSRGQVVIPKEIRKEMKLKPKTKFVVFGYDDTVLLKRMKIPDVKREFKEFIKKSNENVKEHGGLSMKEINEIVHKNRKRRSR